MIENQVISYVINKKSWKFIEDNELDASYFSTYTREFEYIERHNKQYGSPPDIYTFLDMYSDFDYVEVCESEEYLARTLKYEKTRRDSAEAFNRIKSVATSDAIDPDDAVSMISKITEDLSSKLATSHSISYDDTKTLKENAKQKFIERWNARHKGASDNYFLKIGIDWLDEMFMGWDKENDYVVIAGRPGTGKSMLLCKLAAEQIKRGKKVAFYEGEMSVIQTFERIMASLSGVSATSMLKAEDRGDGEKYLNAIKSEFDYGGEINILSPEHIGSRYPTVSQLEAFCRKTKADILFVDQISLMQDQENAKVKFERIGNISRQLKAMRDKLKIPVICASQMNRTQNDGGRIDNNQIAESDGIVQDATRVIMLTSKREEDAKSITFHITKNRTGRSYASQEFNADFARCEFIPIEQDSEGVAEEVEMDGKKFLSQAPPTNFK